MTALTQDRNTPRLPGEVKSLGVAAAQKIFAGAIVMRNAAGHAVKGVTALYLRGVGRADERVDNTAGAAGDLTIKVREGVFRYANSAAADEITIAEIGRVCYAVDDQTVAKTDGAGTRSPAGIVCGVDSLGVQVLFSEEMLAAAAQGDKVFLPMEVGSLTGAGVYRMVSPVAGRVTKIWSVIPAALAAGDATLTGKVGAAAITNGVTTITQAGSAAGDVDSATPTAANVVAAGNVLSLTVGGANTADIRADALWEITL